MNFLLLEGANIWDVYEKYYKDTISKEEYEILAHCDPTSKGDNKGKYLPWIIKAYLADKNGKNYIEAFAQSFNEMLAWYDKHRTQLPKEQQDISRLSYDDVNDIYDLNKDKLFTQKELRGQADIVFDNTEWEIVIPHTWAASKLFGSNTKWCTASNEDDHYFNQYNNQGPLYINIDKRDNTKWQFHPDSESYFDEEDNDLTEGEMIDNGDTIAEYTNMPNDVLSWYKQNVPEIYNAITEPIEGWLGYEICNKSGDFIGYLRNGNLYDQNRELIGGDGDYDDYNAILGEKGVAFRGSNGYDFYEYSDGYFYEKCRQVRDVQEVCAWEGEETGVLIGIDKDNDFVCLGLSNGYFGYEHNYVTCQSVDEGELVLAKDTDDLWDLLTINAENMLMACNIDPNMDIENDGEYVTYYKTDDNGVSSMYRKDIYNDGDEELVESEDEDEYDEEDEEELEPSMSNESVNKKDIMTEFQRLTNKLNEIHKRNIPLFFD